MFELESRTAFKPALNDVEVHDVLPPNEQPAAETVSRVSAGGRTVSTRVPARGTPTAPRTMASTASTSPRKLIVCCNGEMPEKALMAALTWPTDVDEPARTERVAPSEECKLSGSAMVTYGERGLSVSVSPSPTPALPNVRLSDISGELPNDSCCSLMLMPMVVCSCIFTSATVALAPLGSVTDAPYVGCRDGGRTT